MHEGQRLTFLDRQFGLYNGSPYNVPISSQQAQYVAILTATRFGISILVLITLALVKSAQICLDAFDEVVHILRFH